MALTPIPVGIRLSSPASPLGPSALLEICTTAQELGYTSFWIGDHLIWPRTSASSYTNTASGQSPFSPETAWSEPLLTLTWLSAQLAPGARFGTSIVLVPLRDPILLAKQLSTMSWLFQDGISLGVGSGWLAEEYGALKVPFKGRATRARKVIREVRQLVTEGEREYSFTSDDGSEESTSFVMRPLATGRVDFLWGGVSDVALRLVAACCDGWLPTKQSLPELELKIDRLKTICDEAGRDFSELKIVVKPGPGPDPTSGAIDEASLFRYQQLGVHEAVLELPGSPGHVGETIQVLEKVAKRSGLI